MFSLQRFHLSGVVILSLCISLPGERNPSLGGETPGPKGQAAADILTLIDKLVEVSEEGTGSETMRQLVKRGIEALPHLVAHLGDQRKTTIKIAHRFPILGGLYFGERLDYNARTDLPPTAKKQDKKVEQPDPLSHTLTVGDLCFVAIGQIVNRKYDAVRYIPTGIVIVNSPVHSLALRNQVKQAWGSLTRDQHLASLVADFLKPDTEDRRAGACKRLACYYPEALEPLALRFLAEPTYSPGKVSRFVYEQLYREEDPKRRQALFNEFLARNGEPSRDGILVKLFDDLDLQEAKEERRLFPPVTNFTDQPRKLLIELYGKPKEIRSKERPRIETLSTYDKANLIEEGLVYDRSEKIDRAVRELLIGSKDEDEDRLGLACTKRLIGRGYDAEIETYCRRQLQQLTEEWEKRPFQEVLDRLGWTRLHVAVDQDNLDVARMLSRDKAVVNAAARDGKTPLHLAATAGRLELVQILADAGAALDHKDKAGLTPVQLAVRHDHLEVVRFLAGRKCSFPDIMVATAAGRPDLTKAFLRDDPMAAKATTSSGQTLLHLAVYSGDPQVVRVLVAGGVEVDGKNNWSATALHLAAAHGLTKVAAILLEAKASTEAKAMEMDQTPLHLAAAAGHTDLVELLLKHGAAVDSRDLGGRTPLHLAALHNHAGVAERLIAWKADVNAAANLKATPLHMAVGGESVRLVKLLLAHKADRSRKDVDEQTPLDFARELKLKEVIRLLETRD